MTQTQWLPIVCTRTKVAPLTADADFIGIDDVSTQRYLCKSQRRFQYLPASEWICSHLAKACGLPIPDVAIIELASNPGVFLFGSRWEGGALDPAYAYDKVSNPDLFAKTFALDLVTNNDDRHFGNYLYLDLYGDIVLRIIDFSRAWMHHGWPLPALPLPSKCNTMACLPDWMNIYLRHYVKPTQILQTIQALPDDWMKDTLDPMPDAWLTREERVKMREWWIGKARHTRAKEAESCLP